MTQSQAILEHLQAGGALTPLEALAKFGTFRLGARVHELRKSGYRIESKRVTLPSKKIVAEYRLLA